MNMGRLKYLVGQRFKTTVNQQLELGRSNGVPVPFGQVTRTRGAGRVDIPVGSIVQLAADFQAQDDKGGTKRAYVLQVEGSPIYFLDHVLTRKYEPFIDLESQDEAQEP